MNFVVGFFRNRKIRIWSIVIVAALAVAGFWLFGGKSGPTYESITATPGELIQEVSVTGKIKAAQSVDMQFEISGKIAAINYKAGDSVNAGTVIASLENQEFRANVLEAEAGVASARADLDKTIRNFNSLSDPAQSSSLRVDLESAEANLNQVANKANGDLASKYSSAYSTMHEAMTQIDNSSVVLEYLRKTYFETNYTWDGYIRQYQAEVNFKVRAIRNIFPNIDQPGETITPSAYGQVDSSLPELLSACQSLRAAFTYVQEQAQGNLSLVFSSTDRSSVNTEAAAISSDLSAVSSSIRGITDQKILNNKNISDAQSTLAKAKAAFPTTEDMAQKEASWKKAQAALLSAQSQLRKSLIVAPFTGLISKIDAVRGETVTSTKIVVSMISAAGYQIEANITEIDISKIKVGDPVRLTLDAYGPDAVFRGIVSAIDPGETVVEGVTTYKTNIDLANSDERLRPNMTANLDIETNRKENVIAIPQRAVIARNGDKIVKVDKGGVIGEVKVQTGLLGKDGLVEIVSGLNSGDKVVTFVNE